MIKFTRKSIYLDFKIIPLFDELNLNNMELNNCVYSMCECKIPQFLIASFKCNYNAFGNNWHWGH